MCLSGTDFRVHVERHMFRKRFDMCSEDDVVQFDLIVST